MSQGTGVFLPGHLRQQLSETDNKSSRTKSPTGSSSGTTASYNVPPAAAAGSAQQAGSPRPQASTYGNPASPKQLGRINHNTPKGGSCQRPSPGRSLSSPALKPTKAGASRNLGTRSVPTSPTNHSTPPARHGGVPDVQDALFRQEQHQFAVVPISFDGYDDMILSHHQQQQPWQPGELLADSPTAFASDHSHAADVSYSMWLPEEQQQQQQQQLLSNNWLMEDELNMLGFQQQHVPHNNQVAALDTLPDTWPNNSANFDWMQQQLPGCLAGGMAIAMSSSADLLLTHQQQQQQPQQQHQAALPAWLSGPDLVHSSQASPLHSSPASFKEGELLCLRSNASSFTGGIDPTTASPVLPAGSLARSSQHQQQMMQLQHQQAQEAALEAVDAELQMLLKRRQALQQARLQAAVATLASTGNVLSPTTAGSGVMPLLPPLDVAPQAEGLLVGSPLVASPQGPLHLCQSASPATASLVAASAVLPAPVAATSPAQQGADLAAGETLQRLMQVQQRQMELQQELLSLLPRLAM